MSELWCSYHHAEHNEDGTLARCWCSFYQRQIPFCDSQCPHRQANIRHPLYRHARDGSLWEHRATYSLSQYPIELRRVDANDPCLYHITRSELTDCYERIGARR